MLLFLVLFFLLSLLKGFELSNSCLFLLSLLTLQPSEIWNQICQQFQVLDGLTQGYASPHLLHANKDELSWRHTYQWQPWM